MIRAAYLAAPGFEAQLASCADRHGVGLGTWHGPLALSADPAQALPWAQDVWIEPAEMAPAAALAAMRAARIPWAALPWEAREDPHGTATLALAARLVRAGTGRMAFPCRLPERSGAFTLLAEDRVLWAARRQSPFPNGRARFHETREAPSRAYLKLWEALAILGAHPGPGDLCYDLGAAPGGWSWVAASLSARVVAIDRAPLAPSVAAMLGVRHRGESAFGIDPRKEPRVDWLLCDVIAYPPRTLGLVRRWLDAGRAARIIASVKFQGPTDHDSIAAFESIPGGRVVHLSHNRHELTFLWPAPDSQMVQQ